MDNGVEKQNKKNNNWLMIHRQCQVGVLSVLRALSCSFNGYTNPLPPSLPASHRSVTVGLIINFFFSDKNSHSLLQRCVRMLKWKTLRSHGIHCFIWRAIMLNETGDPKLEYTHTHTYLFFFNSPEITALPFNYTKSALSVRKCVL